MNTKQVRGLNFFNITVMNKKNRMEGLKKQLSNRIKK